MKVLVLNGGSSSLKAVLRDLPDGALPDDAPAPLWEASVDWGRHPGRAEIRVRRGSEPEKESQMEIRSADEVLRPVIESLWSGDAPALGGPGEVGVIGHRVVHGGKAFRETT